MAYYTSEVISKDFANTFYYCYRFASSFEFVVRRRLGLFSDFSDWYSSFLFNLLSNSVTIRNIGLNIANYTNNLTLAPLAAGEFGKLIRIVSDFQSVNAESLGNKTTLIKEEIKENAKLKDRRKNNKVEDKLMYTERFTKWILDNEIMRLGAYISPWNNLQFSFQDLYNIPIGFVDGGMQAIQSNVNNYFCSRNSSNARNVLQTMAININNLQITDAVTNFYEFLKMFQFITYSCTESVLTAYVPDLIWGPANNYLGENLLTNILYNLGF